MAVNLSITLLSIFIYISYSYLQIQYIDTINVPFWNLKRCSNWRPPTSMQTWHRRKRFCRTLTTIPGVFWITWVDGPHRGCSTQQFEIENLGSVKPVIQNTPAIFFKVQQNLVRWCHACIVVGDRPFEQLL